MQAGQHKAGLALGVLLLLSPWLIGFGGSPRATWSALLIGIAVAVLAGTSIASPRRWKEWASLLLGIGAFLAPFLVGFTSIASASAIFSILGVLIGAGAVSTLVQTRQHEAA